MLILGIGILIPFPTFASEKEGVKESEMRPITAIYSFEIGRSEVVNTYLSPVKYGGTHFEIHGEWNKVLPFSPRKWMMEFEGWASFSPSLLNPRSTASMMEADAGVSWDIGRYWRLNHNLVLTATGGVKIEGGAQALLKNSNNPVGVNIMGALMIGASLNWETRIKSLPVVPRLTVGIPLTGAFFMPGYGETFYEIYLGNREGLVHALYPGNYPSVDIKGAVMFDFGRTAIELGYHLRWRRSSANNLVDRVSRNMFSIGVIPGGLGMKIPSRKGLRPF